ncbi:putative bifunctional diguanylate cyclase/phosphodiesterase [Syntrophotalea acetylenica]|nr:EAL domain-containing protein [Syntrophotalea acetylenica]APG44409.1 hypothetical protein A6070_10015 [Syntrophotalea acetylenica]
MTAENLNHAAMIQIVDDDCSMRLLARATLEQAGFLVIEAEDGARGLAQFRSMRPDLMLLDVVMPGMDGFSVCRTLRGLPEYQDIPIIMLTGLEDANLIQKAFDAGATDFICKPINWLLLRYRVMHILRTARLHEDLKASRSRLSLAQRIAKLGHWQLDFDSGRFTCSRDLRNLLGIEDKARLSSPEDLLQTVHPDDLPQVRETLEQAIALRQPYQVRYRIMAGEEERHISSQGEIEKTDARRPRAITAIVQDVSDLQQAEQKIFGLAHFDTLTGLAKRRFFIDTLDAAIDSARHNHAKLAVLLLDLDRFKRINESFGHMIGDQVLLTIAKRIRQCLQQCDILLPGNTLCDYCIARFSGNEFAILLPEVLDEEQVSQVARLLIKAIAQPFSFGHCEVLLTTSIGICLFPEGADSQEDLIRHANIAMQDAKTRGRDSFRKYHPAMDEPIQDHLILENDLRKALKNDEFVLHLQPQVDMRSGWIFGAEALIRWKHPQQGLKSPGSFLPVAIESNLIIDIDRWVLGQACDLIARWRTAGLGDLRLSVNVSGQLFAHDNIADLVAELILQSGIRPCQLEIELTENTIMQNNLKTVSHLSRLKNLGVQIAIDDFGTGYSSLSYLRNFPIDTLKIDRSFIRDLTEAPSAIAITRAIIALGESLGLTIICEGIETPHQKEMLMDLGCHHAQGYLFGRPDTLESFTRRLQRQQQQPAPFA